MEMKPPSYDPAYQQRQDSEHLNLLAIFYYVMAGLSAFGGFFPLIYVLFGAIAFGGGAVAGNVTEEERAGLMIIGGVVVVVGLGFSALVWVFAYCLYLTGKYLNECRNRTFCYVMAGLLCLNAPLGAILGIFTFIVLSRDSVKARFEQNQYSQYMPLPGTPFAKV